MARDTCYFDGQCGMCRRSTRMLRRLDWLGRLAFEDMTRTPELNFPEGGFAGMPMRTRDGRLLIGFPAVRRALGQTPMGVLPALALYLPGVSHAGRWVYGWIARNRRRDVCILEAGRSPD
ncbi:MAG: DUF393 domain-containing protein [Phycisphaeraceae bacterium]|nr:DUF393 domain-containing protein [Phycisphaeraceae bacterium]